MRDFLLRLARKIVQEVLDELARQINVLQQQVRQPIESYIRMVVNGAWRGPDADKFINELTNLFIPTLERTTTTVTAISTGVQTAVEVIDRADKAAADMVADLDSQFSKVY